MENFIIILIFAAAVYYTGKKIRNVFVAKNCASGCSACSNIDFKAIENKMIADLKNE